MSPEPTGGNPALEVKRGSEATEATLPLLTYGIASRLLYFNKMLGLVHEIPGDIVECGVGWGRSLLDLAFLVRLEEKGRHLWGFDSFEGFPEPAPQDDSSRKARRGEWKTDVTSIMRMLRGSGLDEEFVEFRITLVKGFFADTLARYAGDPIALLHIDADLYPSYRDALTGLYDKVVPGGVILFDEFMGTMAVEKFPGAHKAIVEFFGGADRIERDRVFGRYYTVKPA